MPPTAGRVALHASGGARWAVCGGGLLHAVVGKNGQIVFDPHPSKAGLAGDPSEWTFDYLIPL